MHCRQTSAPTDKKNSLTDFRLSPARLLTTSPMKYKLMTPPQIVGTVNEIENLRTNSGRSLLCYSLNPTVYHTMTKRFASMKPMPVRVIPPVSVSRVRIGFNSLHDVTFSTSADRMSKCSRQPSVRIHRLKPQTRHRSHGALIESEPYAQERFGTELRAYDIPVVTRR
jgi:hypothetical protein